MSNSLGERILFMNSNLEDLLFFKVNNRYGIYKEQLDLFMQENRLHDKDFVMESICSEFGIEKLDIIGETCESLSDLIVEDNDILNEAINPLMVQDASKGVSSFNKFIDKAAAILTKTEFDESKNLDKYISRCDKMLADIKKEKENIEKGKKSGKVKFTALYLSNIIKIILFDMVIPSIIEKEVGKATTKISAKLIANSKVIKDLTNTLNDIKVVKAVKSKRGYIKTATNIIGSIPTFLDIVFEIKNIVLVAKDYEAVLNNYEKQISNVKKDLEEKKEKLDKENGEMDMTIKEESCLKEYEPIDTDIEDGEVKVNYQSYDDIVNGGIMKPTEEPQNKEVFHDNIDFEDDTVDHIQSSTPLDNINTLRSNPANVPVINRDDNYYIGHNELKCYMDACKKANYESAIKDIIDANDSSDFTLENTSIILTKDELNSLDENTKYNIENSNVNFLVYE